LNSLQMGFRTLAIQKRSGEVWNLLASVKTEFGKFGESLTAVKDKLDQAARKMEDVDVRSRAITRKLRDVEELPSNPQPLLPELLQSDDEDG
jgi:DNA recombination protein RmuC